MCEQYSRLGLTWEIKRVYRLEREKIFLGFLLPKPGLFQELSIDAYRMPWYR